jgi:hypothetical protein
LGQTKQLSPELAGENGILIQNDMSRKPMETKDVIQKHLRDLLSRKVVMQRYEMAELTELINNNHDTVAMSRCKGESNPG